jgi:hypothetical protein
METFLNQVQIIWKSEEHCFPFISVMDHICVLVLDSNRDVSSNPMLWESSTVLLAFVAHGSPGHSM